MPIFDQGYQHWQGYLTPFRWRWLAIARHGVRALLKSKIIKGSMLAAWMPAVALVGMLAVWGLLEQRSSSIVDFAKNVGLPTEMLAKPQEFRAPVWTIIFRYFFKAQVFWAMLLVLAVGPGLISRDLRFNALPLYFSRPIRRIDYFLGKLGVIGFFIAATTLAPAAVAYIVGLAFSLDISVIRDTHRLLWGSILYGLVITFSAGTLMLALSSLSRRSIYVGIAWAGFCFLTMTISGILMGIQFHAHENDAFHTSMEEWVDKNPPPSGVNTEGLTTDNRRRIRIERETPAPPNQQEIEKWEEEYWAARRRARGSAHQGAAKNLMANADWRAVIGYTTNLDRVGDALLGFDNACVQIGKSLDKQRALALPAVAIHTRGKVPKEMLESQERVLADTLAWQFPWQWSAGVLAGLWLFSLWILSMRVKSLDRLK